MNFREKVELAVNDVASRGVPRATAAPVNYRWLWRLGLRVRPPHFQPFAVLAALNGLTIALSFAVPMSATIFLGNPLDAFPIALFSVLLTTSGLIGLGCGVGLAIYYRMAARRLSLPSWGVYDVIDYSGEW